MRVISSRQKNPCKYVSDLNRKNKLIDNKLTHEVERDKCVVYHY